MKNNDFKNFFQNYFSLQFNRATIIIRVFDFQAQIKKSLKVFFLDRFEDKRFIQEILDLFESSKNILRKEILQIYDHQAFFVIEQEDIEAILTSQQLRQHSEEIKYAMQTAINYCYDRINIKQKHDVQLDFPYGYCEYFYIINREKNKRNIKLNLLSPDLYFNPLKNDQIKKDENNSELEKNNQEQEENNSQQDEVNIEKDLIQFENLSLRLNCVNNGTKSFLKIKKENLIEAIKQYGKQLLTYHDIQIFEIIAKLPKYDDFELIEFDQNYFVLGSNIQNKNCYLKAERFQTLKELENISKEYDKYYEIENHMLPVENHEIIILEDNQYLLIQEKILPMIDAEQTDQKSTNISTYKSLEQIIFQNKKYERIQKQDQIRNLQIIMQLIRFVNNLHKYKIYHGELKLSKIIVETQIIFSSIPPKIFFQNPLFMRNKEQKEITKQFNFEMNILQIKDIIFQLLQTISDSLIDSIAQRLLSNEIQQYLQQLITTKNIEYEKALLFYYFSRLNYLFKIFEQAYNDQHQQYYYRKKFERYLKINKKWLVSVVILNQDHEDFHYGEYLEDDEYVHDICKYYKLYQMGVEKVKLIIYSNDEELKEIVQNSNIKSLHIINDNNKADNNNNNLQSIIKILKSCKKLQNLNLDVPEGENGELIDFSYLKDLSDLKKIKLQFSKKEQINKLDKKIDFFFEKIYQFNDLVSLFQSNKYFNLIDIFLPQDLSDKEIYSDYFDYFDLKYQFIFKFIFQNLDFSSEIQYENSQQSQNSQPSIQKEELLTKIQLNLNQKIQVELQTDLLYERQYVKQSEIIYCVEDNESLIQILNRDILIGQLKEVIKSYFKQFKIKAYNTLNVKQNKLDQEQKNFENEVNYLIKQYKYISFFAYEISETNKQLLVLELNHIFVHEIGKLQIKYCIDQNLNLKIEQSDCEHFERLTCYLKQNYIRVNLQDKVKSWMECGFISVANQKVFKLNANQSCMHHDKILMQMKFYQDQLSLKRLTIYLENCDQIVKQMMNTTNYFQFSHHISESLIELNLVIQADQIDYQKCLRKHLECAKSLIKLSIRLRELCEISDLFSSIRKMKRLVMIWVFSYNDYKKKYKLIYPQ